MGAARARPTATLLPDGRVLVAGGFTHNALALASAELYDPNSGTWSDIGNMPLGRSLQTATLLHDGRVLVVGEPLGQQTGSTELYDPSGGT